jgi:hypothetical protein
MFLAANNAKGAKNTSPLVMFWIRVICVFRGLLFSVAVHPGRRTPAFAGVT